MSDISVTRYLSGMAESITRQEPSAPVGRFPFITISRQTGAGGHTLATELVNQINAESGDAGTDWAIFDKAMCEKLRDDPHLGSMLQDLLDETYRSAVKEFVHNLLGGTAQILAYNRLAEVERQVAKLGKVIFIGRGAAWVTKDLPLGVHVRLVAPMDIRKKRMAELIDVDESDAAKGMERVDRERERLIAGHFDADINDPENYDMTWNTARAPVGHIAKTILALMHARMEAHQRK